MSRMVWGWARDLLGPRPRTGSAMTDAGCDALLGSAFPGRIRCEPLQFHVRTKIPKNVLTPETHWKHPAARSNGAPCQTCTSAGSAAHVCCSCARATGHEGGEGGHRTLQAAAACLRVVQDQSASPRRGPLRPRRGGAHLQGLLQKISKSCILNNPAPQLIFLKVSLRKPRDIT
jgi:hypothetical protein